MLKFTLEQATMAQRGASFSYLRARWGELPTPRPGRFTPGKTQYDCIGVWVGTRASMDGFNWIVETCINISRHILNFSRIGHKQYTIYVKLPIFRYPTSISLNNRRKSTSKICLYGKKRKRKFPFCIEYIILISNKIV